MSDLTSEELRQHYAHRVAAFRPLGDQLLVELEHPHSTPERPVEGNATEEAVTPGGIIIPATVGPDIQRTRIARVRAAGPGRHVEGSSTARCPMSCTVGDRVVLDEICLRGPFPEIAPGWHIAHDEQVLAVIEEG